MMKTKTGKRHYACEFTTYTKTGTILHHCPEFKFIAHDGISYMARVQKRYAAHGITVIWKNLVNLDSQRTAVTITLEDNFPGMVIDPVKLPEVVIPEDFDI